MVFLIQDTQNRETRIVALKLDELLRGVALGTQLAVRLSPWYQKGTENLAVIFVR